MIKAFKFTNNYFFFQVYLAKWQGHTVSYSHLANKAYAADFKHGLTMLAKFQPSRYVTQLIGYCKDQYVTEYHPLRSADNLESLLEQREYQQYNTIGIRYMLCINYVEIIHFLHSTPEGARVMCDSNDINKTLNQFLITNDFRLVANDLDALPLINNTRGLRAIKCGHRELYGDFIAPEQQWPYDDQEFSDAKMPGYNEKTDIWKIPDLCEYFLGTVSGSDPLRFKLFKIHQNCKDVKPEKRPSANEVLNEYITAQEDFDLF